MSLNIRHLIVCILITVVCGGTGSFSFAQAPRQGSIAVTDFTMAEKKGQVDTWATGLADYMTVEMARLGVDVLERRDIRYVLSERRLQEEGLLKQDEIIRQRLPWVQYLLKGDIKKIDTEQVNITVSVVDLSSAQVAFEFSAQGSYADGMSVLINKLAKDVAEKVGHAQSSPGIHSEIFGFTKIPEVAVLFYKGMDHYMQNRVTVAEEYFRKAFIADRNFLLAAMWRMKCYEDLALGDLAAWFKRTILSYPDGKQILEMYDLHQVSHKDKIVVTPVLSNEPNFRQEGLFSILQKQLLSHPDIQLFQPDWIKGISSEIDLSVSQEFGFHQLKGQPWLTTDALVTIGAVPHGDTYRVRLQLVDAVSGNIISEEEKLSQKEAWNDTVKDLLADLLVSRHMESDGIRPFHKKTPIDFKPADNDAENGKRWAGDYSLLEYAYVLQMFSEDQNNRTRLLTHYIMHEQHSHQRYEHLQTSDNEWGYLRVLWERFYKLIDKNAEDAADWYSYYLWEKYQEDFYDEFDNNGMYNWNFFNARKVPMETAFSILLNDYPDSFPTIWVKYDIALEKISQNQYAQAALLLQEVVDRLEKSGRKMNNDPLEVNVYYYTALALKESGKPEQAKRYVQRAQDVIINAGKASNVHSPTMTKAIMYSTWNAEQSDGKPIFNVTEADLQFFHWQFRRFLEGQTVSLNDRVVNLDRELRGLSQEKTIEEYYREFQPAAGQKGVDARLNYIGKLTVDMRSKKPLQHDYYLKYVNEAIQWIAKHGNANDLNTLQQYVERFMQAHKDAGSTYYYQNYMVFDNYMAAKMFDQANAMADEYLKKENSGDKYFGIQMKSEILQQTSTPKEKIADFLCQERKQFYADFDPAPMRTYFGLAFQCAGALREMKQYSQALQIYQSAFDETLQGGHSDSDVDQFNQYKASFKFHKAYTLELNNDKYGAAVLYRELLEETEEKGWQPYLDNGDAGGETIHVRSLRRLEDIRRGVFREESEIRKSNLTVRMLF